MFTKKVNICAMLVPLLGHFHFNEIPPTHKISIKSKACCAYMRVRTLSAHSTVSFGKKIETL